MREHFQIFLTLPLRVTSLEFRKTFNGLSLKQKFPLGKNSLTCLDTENINQEKNSQKMQSYKYIFSERKLNLTLRIIHQYNTVI